MRVGGEGVRMVRVGGCEDGTHPPMVSGREVSRLLSSLRIPSLDNSPANEGSVIMSGRV